MRLRLTWLLLAPGLGAEELPAQLQALLHTEPYAHYAAAGVPLPPTESEVLSQPELLRHRRAYDMKTILYRGMARTRADRWRETEQNLAAMAREAAALTYVPPEFTAMLQLRARGNLSRRQAHALRSAMDSMLHSYGVDELQMRLLLDYVDADVKEAEQILSILPLQAVFNMIPQQTLSKHQLAADLNVYADIQSRAARILSTVQDATSADKVLPELKALLILHDTTLPTRALLMQGLIQPETPEIERAAQALGHAAGELRSQRNRLNDAGWFGSRQLKALDFLLN